MTGYQQGPEWCMTQPEPVEVYIKNLRLNKVPFHRCPKCGRRLQLKVVKNAEGSHDTLFPAHKLRKTKRK